MLLVEELLADRGGVPCDFKFHVFHGSVRLIMVELDRFDVHSRSHYDESWERLQVGVDKYPAGRDVERPAALEEMLAISKTLAADMDFLRVDLYCIGDRIVFGELTNYPEAGRAGFIPPEYDRELGAWWTPPRKYGRNTR
jgi:hypothetical protein